VSSDAAREILVHGAKALATDPDDLGLVNLLQVMTEQLDVESAVIVAADGGPDQLAIVASSGLADPALAGLTAALQNPGHPIVRTLDEPDPSFDVVPSQPGGPALRSHLPLRVTRDGQTRVLGVLALAHHRPIDPEPRRLIEATADLAAVALERRART
jgi:GAF domain-containing protein